MSMKLFTLGAMGFEFAVSIIVGIVIGLKVDDVFFISPFGIILGLIGGIFTAVFRLIQYLDLLKERKSKNEGK